MKELKEKIDIYLGENNLKKIMDKLTELEIITMIDNQYIIDSNFHIGSWFVTKFLLKSKTSHKHFYLDKLVNKKKFNYEFELLDYLQICIMESVVYWIKEQIVLG